MDIGQHDCEHAWKRRGVILNICCKQPVLFRATRPQKRLFWEPPSLPKKKRCTLCLALAHNNTVKLKILYTFNSYISHLQLYQKLSKSVNFHLRYTTKSNLLHSMRHFRYCCFRATQIKYKRCSWETYTCSQFLNVCWWHESEFITRSLSNLTKSASRGPIPRLGVTPGGRKLYHWIPGVGFPISVP